MPDEVFAEDSPAEERLAVPEKAGIGGSIPFLATIKFAYIRCGRFRAALVGVG
jgi:hypothetical protein